MPIIVDTSVALKWALAEIHSANANALRRDVLHRREEIVAPTLLLYEATNTLYQAGRDGIVPWHSVAQGLEDILTVVRLRPPTITTAKQAVALARMTTQTYAYDTQFLALAERLNCDLWTADERFQRAMQRHGFAQVRTIKHVSPAVTSVLSPHIPPATPNCHLQNAEQSGTKHYAVNGTIRPDLFGLVIGEAEHAMADRAMQSVMFRATLFVK